MSVVTLLPQSGLISRVGSNLQGQDGSPLTNTTGIGSPANYVKNGITSPNDTTYWSNTGPGSFVNGFYVGVDKLSVNPSGLTFKFRGSNTIGTLTLRDFEVWLRKEHNPSLASDIQVASGLSTISVSTGAVSNYSSNLRIIEANRTAFESGIPNLYMCMSGIISMSAGASGVLNFHEMEVELSGNLSFSSLTGSSDLYIQGSMNSSGNTDLYTTSYITTSGSTDLSIFGLGQSSGNLDLYIAGPIESSGNPNLYISGYSESSGNSDLYILGSAVNSGSLDLFLTGILSSSGSMNLFMNGPIGIPFSGHYVPLSIWSEANSGVFGQVPLTIYNTNTFTPQNAMNMVLEAVGYQTQTGSMNLILSSESRITNQFDLYLCNNYTLSSGWTPLYITTPSGTEGSVPLSGIMNLVMWRDYNSIADWTPLVLSNGGSGNDNIPLYIYGNTVGASSVPMYMFGVGPMNKSAELYTHGF